MTSFQTMYGQFLEDLTATFPEFATALTHAGTLPDLQVRFIDIWRKHTADVAAQNGALFEGAGLELVPGFVLTGALWKELSKTTQGAIWKYLSSLLLLAASTASREDKESDTSGGLWDVSGFQHDMEEMMRRLKEAGGAEGGAGGGMEGMSDMFDRLKDIAGSFGFKDMSGAAGAFKIPEKLFKGHIAKIAEELVKEFKPEDFGISPEMLEGNDPARIFTYLQEVFTKKPEMLMTAAQKIAKKIQAKFQSGAIRREDIIREAEELMAEFSDNEAFSSLFGSLGEMLKGSEKESGNMGSVRRREVQERLRKKKAEKDMARATTSSTSNIIVSNDAELRAAEAATALLLEEATSPTGPIGSSKKGATKKR